jgi:uncharacterized protein
MSNNLTPNVPSFDFARIAQDLQIRKVQVEGTAHGLADGHTPSFLARYRKDQIHGLSEDHIRVLRERFDEIKQLAERKETILKLVASQGKLTDELKQRLHEAESSKRIEDLYQPFKPKKKSIAAEARDKGLEACALAIWNRDPVVANLPEIMAGMLNPEKQLHTTDDVLAGLKLILTEHLGDMADVRAPVRFALWESGRIVVKKAEPKAEPAPEPTPAPAPEVTPAPTPEPSADANTTAPPPVTAETPPTPPAPTKSKKPKKDNSDKKADEYRDYFNFSEGLREIPPHRILAINRGEREHVLTSTLDWNLNVVREAARSKLNLAEHPHRDLLEPLVDEALTQIVLPSLEREIRKELMEEALGQAIEIFARNFRSLLLTPPLRNKRVLAIDPGSRGGCKAVALDEKGAVLGDVTVHPLPPQNQVAETKAAFANLIRTHQLNVIALGNGPSCREVEQVVSDLLAELEQGSEGNPPLLDVQYVITTEAGAADYADSAIAREELPNVDRATRGAISIGRRLQDPLAELVKIDPQHVGVGLYQHDLKPKHMKESIDEVTEACVNEVGVDLNTASASLLRHVSGLNPALAQMIVQYRAANGPFRSRAQLLQVPTFTEAKYLQAAGFLKVYGGDEPLDETWVHPERYALANTLLSEAGFTAADLRDAAKRDELRSKLAALPSAETATRLGVTETVLADVVRDLSNPYADPRDSRTPPNLKKRMLRLEDLTPEMNLKGTVVNVVPFGAFVDIGLKDTGLVHISRMANKYIKNPYEIVGVGDVVDIWVVEVDQGRKRASLAMVPPGQERKPQPKTAFTAPPPREPRRDQPRESRPPHGERGDRRPPRDDQRRDGPPRGPRPPRPNDRRPPRPPRPAPPPSDTAPAAEAAPPKKPKTPKPLPKLSSDALTGKAPLFSFAELEAFMKSKNTAPDEKKEEPPKE